MEKQYGAIKRRKNGGDIILKPLENGFEDLKDGDEYVYLGKHNKVLLWRTEKAVDTNIAKVLWVYNVKDRDKIINKFEEELLQRYKTYFLEYNMVNELDLKDHGRYEEYTECIRLTQKEFFEEELYVRSILESTDWG